MTRKWIWTGESGEMGECPYAIGIVCASAPPITAMAGRNGTENK